MSPTSSDALGRLEFMRSLPVPTYAVTRDGTFLFANSAFRRLFGMSLESDISEANIATLYVDPGIRHRLLEQVEHTANSSRGSLPLGAAFVVPSGQQILEVYCTTLQIGDAQETTIFVGCLMDPRRRVTSAESLFEYHGIGSMRVNRACVVLSANDTAVRLLGDGQLVGKSLLSLVPELQATGSLPSHGTPVVTRRPHVGHDLFVELVFQDPSTGAGEETDLLCTIADVTARVNYDALIRAIPAGMYMIRELDGREIIVAANNQFAGVMDQASVDDVVGKSIDELHGDLQQLFAFRTRIHRAFAAGKPVVALLGDLVTQTKRRKRVESSCDALRSKEGTVIGRVGLIRDVSQDSVQRAAAAFRHDFATLLHGYGTHVFALRAFVSDVERVVSLARPDVRRRNRPMSIVEVVHGLATACRALETGAKRSPPRLQRRWVEAIRRLDEFAAMSESKLEERWPTLRELAFNLAMFAGQQSGVESRELLRSLRSAAFDAQLWTLWWEARKIGEALEDVDYTLAAAREWILLGTTETERVETDSLLSITREAVSSITLFAHRRGVSVRVEGDDSARVKGSRRDLVRIVCNLVHNAVKYSWSRGADGERWIECHVSLWELGSKAGQGAMLQVENYGVGIPEEELVIGTIFLPGTRGRWATDRGRTGTGIGLADTRQVADDLEGEVWLTSHPVGVSTDDLRKRPHLTTAHLWLPLA